MRAAYLIACLLVATCSNAQLLTWTPEFIQEPSATVEITGNSFSGNQGLLFYTPTSDVYVHMGVITNYSTSSADWKHVPSFCVWATTPAQGQCTYVSTNKWKYTITGGLRAFFNITDPNEKILKIALLMRNGNGTKKLCNSDGTDMYIPIYDNGLYARIDEPYRQPTYNSSLESINKTIGDNVNITAKASQSSTMKIFFNGTQIATSANATQLSTTATIASSGTQTIIAEANNGTVTKRDTVSFLVTGTVNVAALPAGLKDGINYESDPTALSLVLYAPNKTRVAIVGDFNNWTPTLAHQMNKTPDGNRWWLRVAGLTAGTEYAYQYIIDNSLKVPDYNAEKILDPNNDQYISATTYPALKPYPTGLTSGIVSIFQTNKTPFNWQATSYVRPDKKNLAVYELLVRDFVATQNWQTLKDTLNYLKKLGINAIELLPINEFEGNNSWGYNPSFYLAPDKAYGTETALKQFIDACHLKGIAVIMDIAMNHSFGQSPMVQMYFNSAAGKPASDNPWFNQDATHPYSVGYDFNHESQATKDFVDKVVTHWLTNYKIDGFRWDLSKGFTQTNNPNDVNAWSNYDASRINIWKRIYDKMQTVSSNSYCILEHFAANAEENELSNYGMLLWGNLNNNFNQATLGFPTDWNFQYGIFTNRGWSNPHLITYQESHDEERLQYKNTNFGNSSGGYNVRDLATGLKRDEMAASFWAMIPGPKMMWQFEELGYDNTINLCENSTISNNCRTNPKPIRWDYYQDANRKALFTVYSKLLRLKTSPLYTSTFTSSNISYNLNNGFKSMQINEPGLRVMVIGNFDVVQQTGSVTFPASGNWYNFLSGGTRFATGSSENITLQPGEYYVYTDRNAADIVLSLPNITTLPGRRDSSGYIDNYRVRIYPNPSAQPATIDYSLLQSGNLTIGLTDINGKELVAFYSGFKPKGTYSIKTADYINSAKLATGMYLLQINFNNKRRTIKYMVAK
ncbi:MAG: T9SS type A sorting domain-containing protein [Chitinophagaceae bacterium]|nr:T9SS type A sorting domain-containing protein [Chitinophagaceae bacterium]